MHEPTRQRLLELNRDFYRAVAQPFHATRQGWTPGKTELLAHVPERTDDRPLTVADVGCGNGRLALMLESLDRPCAYTGVDGNGELLELARQQTVGLAHVQTRFFEADLANREWIHRLGEPAPRFDFVVCLATLQHMPGYDLRLAVMRDLMSLVAPGGLLAVSAWQFLTSARFVEKQIGWDEIDVDAANVEPGDALLPWKQGAYAVRYVHQIDEGEMAELARAAGLDIYRQYRADGKEGNLNLYTIMQVE